MQKLCHGAWLGRPQRQGGEGWEGETQVCVCVCARLSEFTFTFHFHALEKEMATHSSVLAWRIPGTGEPGGLPMDRGAWWAAVHAVTEGQTRLSDFTFTFHFHALEKELATHSSVLAWRIPGMVEPGGLPSMGSHRVGHT